MPLSSLILMPVLSGIDATRAIRERQKGQSRRTPIVAMTAYAMAGDGFGHGWLHIEAHSERHFARRNRSLDFQNKSRGTQYE